MHVTYVNRIRVYIGVEWWEVEKSILNLLANFVSALECWFNLLFPSSHTSLSYWIGMLKVCTIFE